MVLRTIHELFEADTVSAINSIILNGWVTSLDKATGHEASRCILTINATKQGFLTINLANIDPRECFKKLKGIGSAKLSALIPVAPILNLNMQDRRFVQSYDVTSKIQEGDNLAIMHWEDFEHLIRELFERILYQWG
jgi:restriction system protein